MGRPCHAMWLVDCTAYTVCPTQRAVVPCAILHSSTHNGGVEVVASKVAALQQERGPRRKWIPAAFVVHENAEDGEREVERQ